VTLLTTIKKHHISIHCTWCNHSRLTTVAKILAVVPNDYTFARLKKNAKCNKCGRQKADLRIHYVTPECERYHEENPRLDL